MTVTLHYKSLAFGKQVAIVMMYSHMVKIVELYVCLCHYGVTLFAEHLYFFVILSSPYHSWTVFYLVLGAWSSSLTCWFSFSPDGPKQAHTREASQNWSLVASVARKYCHKYKILYVCIFSPTLKLKYGMCTL